MSTNFPTSLDSYTVKNNGDLIDASHVDNLQDAVTALETKVGADSSAVTISLDYITKHLPVANISTTGTPSSTTFLRGDGAWATAITFGYGDGSDGAVVLDGTNTYAFLTKVSNTYTMTRDIFCTNFTLNSSITIVPANYRVFVNGTASGNGIVAQNGNVGTSGTAASGDTHGVGGAGGAAIAGYFSSPAGGAGGSGADGLNGTGGSPATAGVSGSNITNSAGSSGNAGGAGGNGDGTPKAPGAGGTGGTATSLTPSLAIQAKSSSIVPLTSGCTFSGVITGQAGAGGGGGGGYGFNGSSNHGGGGGGGGAGSAGGFFFMCAKSFTGSYTFNLNGGAGGNGGAGSGGNGGFGGGGGGGAGSGGNGGIAMLIYGAKSGSNTYNVSGGTVGSVGTATNGGSAGSVGSAGATGASFEIAFIF